MRAFYYSSTFIRIYSNDIWSWHCKTRTRPKWNGITTDNNVTIGTFTVNDWSKIYDSTYLSQYQKWGFVPTYCRSHILPQCYYLVESIMRFLNGLVINFIDKIIMNGIENLNCVFVIIIIDCIEHKDVANERCFNAIL